MSLKKDQGWITHGYTKKVVFACGNVYLTVNEVDKKPFRVFLKLGKAGQCERALLEAVARMTTIMLQDTEVPLERIIKTLGGIRCEKGAVGRLSCMDALSKELKQYAEVDEDGYL